MKEMGAAARINKFPRSHLFRSISRISELVKPKDKRAWIATLPLVAFALILLPELPKVFFAACQCGTEPEPFTVEEAQFVNDLNFALWMSGHATQEQYRRSQRLVNEEIDRIKGKKS